MNNTNPQHAVNIHQKPDQLSVTNESAPKFNIASGIGVLKALNAIQGEIIERGGIKKKHKTEAKDGFPSFHFRGIDDIYNFITPLLFKHGLCCVPHVKSVDCAKMVRGNGTVFYKTVVVIQYTFLSSEDGSSFECCMFGEANDTYDKAGKKALSDAQKYLFIQIFSIPTKDSQDNHQQQNGYDHYQQQGHVNADYSRQNKQSRPPAPGRSQLASLELKKHIDDNLRPFGSTLAQELQDNNLRFDNVTEQQARDVYKQFQNRYAASNKKH